MGDKKTSKQLAKFLSYVLGRRPDEFGLVPDREGYVKIKELLKAINEEAGWRHVRKSLIDELIVVLPSPSIEIKDKKIRAVCRDHLSGIDQAAGLPKLLYTCVTQKSYLFVLEKGILPTNNKYVVLSSSPEMAKRIGKRKDSSPVLLTVNVQNAVTQDVIIYQAGELIYLVDYLPPTCFSGPPLPKQKVDVKRKPQKEEPQRNLTPGSFELDLHDKNQFNKQTKTKKGKDISWKRDKKRIRKEKKKDWPM